MIKKQKTLEELLIRFFRGTSSPIEEEILHDLFQDPSLELQIKGILREQLNAISEKPDLNSEENSVKSRILRNIRNRYTIEKKENDRIRFIKVTKIAAVLLILFCLGGIVSYLIFGEKKKKPEYYTVHAPAGSKTKVKLPDGTEIWLNAESQLMYPSDFGHKKREVILEGEAYFHVTRQAGMIFQVKTSDLYVRVYGTQFNVKSYPEDNFVQTTLVEGSLSIEPILNAKKTQPIFIKPHESFTYYKSNVTENKQAKTNPPLEPSPQNNRKQIIITSAIDPIPITSWKDEKWVIVSEELGELAVKLERRFNVIIQFENEDLKHYKFTGTLKSQTFEQVLRIIQESAPILFTLHENQVIFREDPTYRKKYDSKLTR